MPNIVGVDSHDLDRFVFAQAETYERARAEIAAGRKQSHWMWFIFPQIDGLGFSAMSKRYAIRGLEEAKAYLQHPILGHRLAECAETLLALGGRPAAEVFGATDAMKLRSSLTLFACASLPGSVFHRALRRYFPDGPDRETLDLLGWASADQSSPT